MSISQALNNAITGLNASSRMAEVTSSNLSNALTDGYGRRVLEVSAASIGGQGAGVRIDGVVRLVDRALIADRRGADSDMSFAQTRNEMLVRLDRILAQADDPASLGARLAAFESALIAAGADPASDQLLSNAVARLGAVTETLDSASRDIQSLRQEADAAIARDIDTLNAALLRIERLNADISESRVRGLDPSGLMDERQRAIDTVAGIVPVRELQRENGRIALMTPGGEILIDGTAGTYGFQQVNTITPDMKLASGGLFGITRDGVPMSLTDGFGRLAGGSLEAAFQMRDDVLVTAQTGLDQIAADLIARFEDPATDPSRPAGTPGLLTNGGMVLDPADITGLAQRLAINAAVDPVLGGIVTRLRDGVGAAVPGPVGDAAQITRWLDALAARTSTAPGATGLSATGLVARFGDATATRSYRAEEELSFQTARRDRLYQAELAQGVDTDAELQTLLRIEQAYAANARLIQAAGSMIQTLMEI